MKNNLLKLLLLTIIYSQSTFSMEDPNHPNDRPILNSSTSQGSSSSDAREKDLKQLSRQQPKNYRELEDTICQNVKILSFFNLMEKIADYLNSIKELNEEICTIPDDIRSLANNDKSLNAYKKYLDDYIKTYEEYQEKQAQSCKKQVQSCNKNIYQYMTSIKIFNLPDHLIDNIKTICKKLIEGNYAENQEYGKSLLSRINSIEMMRLTQTIYQELIEIIQIEINKTHLATNNTHPLMANYNNSDLVNLNLTSKICDNLKKIPIAFKKSKVYENALSYIKSSIINNNDFINFMDEFYRHLTLLSVIMQYINNDYITDGYLSLRTTQSIINQLARFNPTFEDNKPKFKQLYDNLLSQHKEDVVQLRNCRNKNYILLKVATKNLFTNEDFSKTIFEPKNIAKHLFSDNNDNNDNNNFIDANVRRQQEEAAKKRLKAREKRKKQKAKRAQNKNQSNINEELENTNELENAEELQAIIESIEKVKVNLKDYDPRILQWFDPDFRKEKRQQPNMYNNVLSPDSLLYHSFPLQIDYLIKKYGAQSTKPNATRRNQIDTIHKIPGTIFYKDSIYRQTLYFSITIGEDGTIYHRGLEFGRITYIDMDKNYQKGKIELISSNEDDIKLINKGKYKKIAYFLSGDSILLYDGLNQVNIKLHRNFQQT